MGRAKVPPTWPAVQEGKAGQPLLCGTNPIYEADGMAGAGSREQPRRILP